LFEAPGLIDRAVLMHPLIPWTPQPNPALAGRKILITAGRHDPICPLPLTEALVAYLESQGADVDLVLHAGGHEVRQEEIDAIAAFMTAL
jgi:phospholipase/carboxylesterase